MSSRNVKTQINNGNINSHSCGNRPAAPTKFHFVTSTHGRGQNKRTAGIMSHVAKAQWRHRKPGPLRSWIDEGRSMTLVNNKNSLQSIKSPTGSDPTSFGGPFSGTPLPWGIEPHMIGELVRVLDIGKNGVYPYEICLRVHPAQRGWFPTMIGDICCVHSMMYSVRAFLDTSQHDKESSLRARFHFDQTLRLLQSRIDTFRCCQQHSVLNDPTIMTIITLINAAEIIGDYNIAQNHLNGLLEIVNIRGGIGALNTYNNLHVKVCRADLGIALRTGATPRLFQNEIKWECFIADKGLFRCTHPPFEPEIHAFINTLDARLTNCWRDLHAFSCLSNLVYQTTRKMSPETYNEMMISILYRLTHLSFEADALHETIRLALLAYCTTLFLTRQYLDRPYQHLVELSRAALSELRQSQSISLPASINLWLAFTYHVVAFGQDIHNDEEEGWLDKAISSANIERWSQAHQILRAVMWVDFVHGATGKHAYMTRSQSHEQA